MRLALVGSVALAVALAGPGAAVAADRALLSAVRTKLPIVDAAGQAAAGGAGGPDAVQRQYDTARDLEETLRAAEPVSAGCGPLLAAAGDFARGNVMEAEGFDRPAPWLARAGRRKVAAARARLDVAQARCRPRAAAPVSFEPELSQPRSGEAFFGTVQVIAPVGAAVSDVYVGKALVATVAVDEGRVDARLTLAPGRYDLRVRFRSGMKGLGSAESRDVWLLPVSAQAAAQEVRDIVLAKRLAGLSEGFDGYSATWVHDLTTGRTAGWNADARFPAASTVKLAVLVAALDRFGPRPEQSRVAYDLAALAGWSSNLATNRLLVAIGGSQAAGAAIAQATLWQLGARSSTFTGGYRAGTATDGSGATSGAPHPPPLVSARVTTARDLGRLLFELHAAALGRPESLRRTRLTVHEARVGLAMLLSSQAIGENVGLFRPSVGRSLPMAQKHGWLRDALHTAAVLYDASGPKIVVLLTYRAGLTRAVATHLGMQLMGLLRDSPSALSNKEALA